MVLDRHCMFIRSQKKISREQQANQNKTDSEVATRCLLVRTVARRFPGTLICGGCRSRISMRGGWWRNAVFMARRVLQRFIQWQRAVSQVMLLQFLIGTVNLFCFFFRNPAFCIAACKPVRVPFVDGRFIVIAQFLPSIPGLGAKEFVISVVPVHCRKMCGFGLNAEYGSRCNKSHM